MNRSTALAEKLVKTSQRLFRYDQPVLCSLDEIETLIRKDAVLFERALTKVRRYANRHPAEKALNFQNACHVYKLMVGRPWCQYCCRQFSRCELLGPEMQLDHFYPRSKKYESAHNDFLPDRVFKHHHYHRLNLIAAAATG
jgi:hypothetical protein